MGRRGKDVLSHSAGEAGELENLQAVNTVHLTMSCARYPTYKVCRESGIRSQLSSPSRWLGQTILPFQTQCPHL